MKRQNTIIQMTCNSCKVCSLPHAVLGSSWPSMLWRIPTQPETHMQQHSCVLS